MPLMVTSLFSYLLNPRMETEMRRLETTPIPTRSRSQASIDGSSSELRYTSLKDIIHFDSFTYCSSTAGYASISGGGGGGHTSIHEVGAFDSSAICIRNQLVKHAASAYLQSAAILATRNQNCLTRLWRRLQRRQASASWRGCVRDPFEACVGFMAWSVRRVLACIASYVSGVRPRGGWTAPIP